MSLEDEQFASPADDQNQDVTESAAASTADDENLSSSQEGAEAEAEESLSDVIAKAANGEDDESDTGGDEANAEDDETTADKPKGEKPDGEDDTAKADGQKAEDEEDDGSDLEEGQRIPYDRFKKVINQRNEVKQQLQSIEQERDQYRQGHQQFEAIQGFMKQNSLQTEDVVEALQIAAAFNSDPAKAAELLAPKMQTLQKFNGEILPDDLQQRVETGELSQPDAQEIVRLRHQNALRERQTQQVTQQQQQAQRVQAQQQAQGLMAQAANQEQQRLAQSDPEFQKKLPWVRDRLQVLIQQSRPQSAEQAAGLVREAYDSVTRDMSGLVPRRKEVPKGPSSTQGGGTSTTAREPQSMAEAIALAAGQTTE